MGKLESEFQKLSPGGAISYVEVPNMQNNLEALDQLKDLIGKPPKTLNRCKKSSYPEGIPVKCVELDKTFSSAKAAAEQLKVSYSSIIKCCKYKTRHTAGGYHWQYAKI